jgi:hypothetical protein
VPLKLQAKDESADTKSFPLDERSRATGEVVWLRGMGRKRRCGQVTSLTGSESERRRDRGWVKFTRETREEEGTNK